MDFTETISVINRMPRLYTQEPLASATAKPELALK
jgi:hypothetical protein